MTPDRARHHNSTTVPTRFPSVCLNRPTSNTDRFDALSRGLVGVPAAQPNGGNADWHRVIAAAVRRNFADVRREEPDGGRSRPPTS